jgi:hypothetical protein
MRAGFVYSPDDGRQRWVDYADISGGKLGTGGDSSIQLINFVMGSNFHKKNIVFDFAPFLDKIKNDTQVITRAACQGSREYSLEFVRLQHGSKRVFDQKS